MEKKEIAIFGAGCFWHVQNAFDALNGVTATEVGYAGGEKKNVSYEEVCRGGTGHTEVVRVEFNPDVISYNELLNAFWKMHDPTTVNKQGADVGYQYRSVIFYRSEDQKKAAETSIKKLNESGTLTKEVVTVLEKASTYCRAEEYHQKYFEKTGKKSCHF